MYCPSGTAKIICMGTGVRRPLRSPHKLSGSLFCVAVQYITRGKLVEEINANQTTQLSKNQHDDPSHISRTTDIQIKCSRAP